MYVRIFVSLRTGDITLLGIGAIVNPTSESFSDKNPISDAIHLAAGPELRLTLKTEVRSESAFLFLLYIRTYVRVYVCTYVRAYVIMYCMYVRMSVSMHVILISHVFCMV